MPVHCKDGIEKKHIATPSVGCAEQVQLSDDALEEHSGKEWLRFLDDVTSLQPPLAERCCCGRENKKAEVLSEKRRERAPPVVALLPLSQAVDAQQLWNLILGAFLPPVSPTKHGKGEAMEEDTTPGEACCQQHMMPAIGRHESRPLLEWQNGMQDTQELACFHIRLFIIPLQARTQWFPH